VTAGKQSTTGMRWSIGADIGWLNGEPRAGEVVRATEALGVKWDVHAHNSADRVKVANRISTLGGHPTGVASGLTTSEIDLLRTPQTGVGLTAWQATIVWGLVLQPNHGAASDYFATGMWRPLSAAAYNQHDPNANLIAVGGGDHLPTSIENLATTLAAIPNGAPASATLMVDPDTLVIHGTTSTIDTLEQWATSMSARSNVRWATIDESAAAWVAAGGISSLRAP
jgi:hypothetical protein